MGINSKTWQPDVEYGHTGKKIIRSSWSLCPSCIEEEKYGQARIPSVIYEDEGEVWQEKYCGRHGIIREVYWEDYEMYSKASKYWDNGLVIQNPKITKKKSCPLGCGLCPRHRSHTALGNIVVTNRCNLACWYCFFYAREGGWVYEPTLKQIEEMLHNLKETKPVGANVVQLTGGEPTLRQDLMEIIKMARRTGYQHIMLNTNGVRLAFNPGLVKQITRAGSARGGDSDIILYMSFDGVSPETNSKNYWETPWVIENCRKAGLQIVLVPTVIRGVNDHEVGDIVRFAVANMDVVRGVNFQPVSLVGRMSGEEREAKRITIPGVIKALETQLGYTLTGDDFFPVPCVTPLTDLLEALSGKKMYRLSIHFACGMATYLLKHHGTLHPITHFIDIEGLMSSLKKCRGRPGALATLEMLLSLRRHVKKTPEKFSLKEMLYAGFFKAEYTPFLELQRNAFFIGMMHFQDLYNYDVERVRRCGIHYATPDGRIIPFCAFNVLPRLYRDEIQKRFGTPVEEWEADKERKLADDRYVRRFSAEEKEEIADYYHRCIGKGSKILGAPPLLKPS